MWLNTIFFNSANRPRSGWRLAIFVALFIVSITMATIFAGAIVVAILGRENFGFWTSIWGNVVQSVLGLSVAILVGWVCARILEGLPLKALGWAFHKGWFRDLIIGSAIGGLSLLLAALVATAGGGLRFSLNTAPVQLVLFTVLRSIAGFLLFAAAEEALFRGYPMQTMTRAGLAWVAIVLTSAIFASAHLANPNVVARFTFINTTLAGIWLAVAFLKTRSLWLALGVHWSWNWMMGAILGIPVSGIVKVTPDPFLRAVDFGPAWLTGGSYGIEGGAACTLALVISTIWMWRTRALRSTPEMLALSDRENPVNNGILAGATQNSSYTHQADDPHAT